MNTSCDLLASCVLALLMAGCSTATVCDPRAQGAAPAVACTTEYAGVEYCTAPASGTFFSCSSGAGCWAQGSDGPCWPPVVDPDGGATSCVSGQWWKARDCAGVDAGVRECFGRTLAECARGCWYPVGVCSADAGR